VQALILSSRDATARDLMPSVSSSLLIPWSLTKNLDTKCRNENPLFASRWTVWYAFLR